jgi:hypothetical protein
MCLKYFTILDHSESYVTVWFINGKYILVLIVLVALNFCIVCCFNLLHRSVIYAFALIDDGT